LVGRVVGHADGLMLTLNRAAGIRPADRPNAPENIQQTCGAVQLLNMETPDSGFYTETGLINAKVWQAIIARQDRTDDAIRELLGLSAYLASDLVDLLISIQNDSHFKDVRDQLTLRQAKSESHFLRDMVAICLSDRPLPSVDCRPRKLCRGVFPRDL
jgi:hypothetical protein